jgi:hypothetical protein
MQKRPKIIPSGYGNYVGVRYNGELSSPEPSGLAPGERPNLLFVPMIIPEILDYLEETDLEDWLTAAFIENQRQLPLDHLCTNGGHRSASRIPDIWMVELTNRTGKLWNGRFNVEFSEERRNGTEPSIENQTGELQFTLDTETAEVTFDTSASPRHQDRDANILLS